MIIIWPNERANLNPWLMSLYATFRTMGFDVHGFEGVRSILKRPRLLVVNWIESPLNKGNIHYLFIAYRLALLFLTKALDIKLIWIVHNAGPHDRSMNAIGRWYLRRVARLADGLVILNEETPAILSKTIKLAESEISKKIFFVPHGPYAVTPASGDETAQYDFGFFGTVRRYKRTFSFISEEGILEVRRVLVAGMVSDPDQCRVWQDLSKRFRGKLTVFDSFLGDDEFVDLIKSCETVILPYSGGELNSGIGHLCASVGTPVLGLDTPSVRQIRRDWGEGFVTFFERGATLSSMPKPAPEVVCEISEKLEERRKSAWEQCILAHLSDKDHCRPA